MRIVKIAGKLAAGLVGVGVLLAGVLYAVGSAKFSKTYEISPAAVAIPDSAAAVEHGAYLYAATCSGCHGPDGSGTAFFTDPQLASIPAPNLTPGEGGIGTFYSDADYVRAIRHGVRPNGEALAIMPSQAFWHLSDPDLGDIIAYLKNLPAVDRDWAPRTAFPVGRILVALGVLDIFPAEHIDHTADRAAAPAREVAAAYGAYLVDIGDCALCHGSGLSGGVGPEPGAPAAPNLTPGGHLGEWTAEDFIVAMRTGVSPDGDAIDGNFMPWREVGLLNDDDLTALYLYLQSLPAVEGEPVVSAP